MRRLFGLDVLARSRLTIAGENTQPEEVTLTAHNDHDRRRPYNGGFQDQEMTSLTSDKLRSLILRKNELIPIKHHK